MITSQYFNITSDASIFASNRHIANKQHCSIWVKSLSNVWTQIPYNDYDLVNNSIILDTALLSTIYSQVELRVADSQEELGTPVTDISTTASIRDEVIIVADNINDIKTVVDNISYLNSVADNIVKAGAVADNINNVIMVADDLTNINAVASNKTNIDIAASNITEIQNASTNANIATTKALEASTSATSAYNSSVSAGNSSTNASNSEIKANKWADNNYNVEVETGKYSAKHWATVSQNSVGVKVVENISSLKTFNVNEVNQVEVLGYYTKGDGGGGLFYWDSASTEIDNGGTIIQATEITTGRWKRVYSGAVNVKWFGAVGDGVTDDTEAIQAAINTIEFGEAGSVELEENKTYNISSTITAFNKRITFDGKNSTLKLITNASYVIDIESTSCVIKNLTIAKESLVVSSGIRIKGSRFIVDNVKAFDSKFTNVFYLDEVWESFFNNIRVDNDVSGLTGRIIYLHGSVNNTFSNCNIGYCNQAVYSDTYLSTEGIQFTNIITVFCNIAFNFDKITNCGIVNSVLDFNTNIGIYAVNGQSLYVDNCWIAMIEGSTGSCIGVHANFSRAFLTNNTLVGNGTSVTAAAIGSSGTSSFMQNNTYQNLNFGIFNDETSLAINNTKLGGGTSTNIGNSPVQSFINSTFTFNRNIEANNFKSYSVNVDCIAGSYVFVTTLPTGTYIASQNNFQSNVYGAVIIFQVAQDRDLIILNNSANANVGYSTNSYGSLFFKFPISMIVETKITKIN